MTEPDQTEPPDPRVDLSDAATLTCRHAELVVVALDPTTLGLVLAIDTAEFGKLAVHLSIHQASELGKECRRATKATPQAMAALMQMMTNNKGDQTP